MKKYNFLAFDIGATSGRAVLGTLVGDKFEMQELHSFPNAIFGTKYKAKAELAGGIILVLLGLKILLEHLSVV